MVKESVSLIDKPASFKIFLKFMWIFICLIVGICIICIGLYIWKFTRDLSPSYQAKGAIPIIDALNTFYSSQKSYPKKPSELASYLPSKIVPVDRLGSNDLSGFSLYGSHNGITWYYTSNADGKSYELSRQIRDEGLYYDFDGNKGTWFLNPGDGSEIKTLHLNP